MFFMLAHRRWRIWLLRFAVVSALGVCAPALWGQSKLAKTEPLDPDHAAKMARGLELFKKSVRGVLSERCVKCHGGKATEAALDLTEREKLLKGGDSGPAILVGKGKESLLYKLVSHAKE